MACDSLTLSIDDVISKIEVFPIRHKGDLLARVKLCLADSIVIICFLRRTKGDRYFIGWPRRQSRLDGSWEDQVIITSPAVAERIVTLVLEAYQHKLRMIEGCVPPTSARPAGGGEPPF